MPHPDTDDLDDGTLEAFLDGALPADEVRRVEARLAASPALRARLEAARAIREEAAALLALVEPGPLAREPAAAPLNTGARATPGAAADAPAAARRRTRPWYDQPAWRWAAGVLLVAGAAWAVRPDAARTPEREPTDAPAPAAAPATAPAIAPATLNAPPSAPSAVSTAPEVRLAAPGTAQDDRSEASAERNELRPTIAAKAAPAITPPTPTAAPRPAPLGDATTADAATGQRAIERAAEAAPAPLAAAPSASGAIAPAPLETRARRAAAPPPPAPPPPAPGRLVSLAEAGTRLGSPVRTLAGLAPQRVVLRRESPPLVALDYVLADGRLVVLEQEPAASAPADGGWTDGPLRLRLAADLPGDSLAALRRLVRPAASP